MSYQIIIVVGHLGQDPQMRYTNDGRAVCSFSVAHNPGKDRPAIWHNVTAWDKQAETCYQYLKRGSLVTVTGTCRPSAYTAKNGQPAASLEVTAREVRFLSSGSRDEADDPYGYAPPEDVSDIPF